MIARLFGAPCLEGHYGNMQGVQLRSYLPSSADVVHLLAGGCTEHH